MNKLFASVLTLALLVGSVVAAPSTKEGTAKVILGAIWLKQIWPILKASINGIDLTKIKLTSLDQDVELTGMKINLQGVYSIPGTLIKVSEAGKTAITTIGSVANLPDHSFKNSAKLVFPGIFAVGLIAWGLKDLYNAYKLNQKFCMRTKKEITVT